LDVGSWKLEVGCWKLVFFSSSLRVRSAKQDAGYSSFEI